jgi:hypothetical protein
MNMEDEPLHIVLTTVSHVLTIPEESLRECNEYMQTIFSVLQQKSRYKLDRCRLSGGVAKKTSIVLGFDYDCIVYINDEEPPFTDILDEWKGILTQNLDILIKNLRCTAHSIQFDIRGHKYDVLPAPNYSTRNQDIKRQANAIWTKIKNSENSSYITREKMCHRYSSGLSELAVEFMQKQSAFVHDLCRLAKFWNYIVWFGDYVSGRSSIIEYLAVKTGREEEEQTAMNNSSSMLHAFRRFLLLLTGYNQIGIVFDHNYTKESVPKYEKPFLIDPSNPYNNFLANIPDHFMPTLARYSQETLTQLNKFERNFFEEIKKFHYPKPTLRYLFSDNVNMAHVNMAISNYRNCKEISPQLIIRRQTFNERTIENMSQLMECLLKNINTIIQIRSEENVTDKIAKATERFIVQAFHFNDHQWNAPISSHETFDVTFILPLNTRNRDAIYISMSK